MTLELTLLAWSVVLGVVQLFLTAAASVRQNGLGWAASPRDQARTPQGIAARLRRAQDNLMETLPFFAIAVLVAHLAGREGGLTAWGASLYLVGRVAYVPLYAFGVMLRPLAWAVAMVGLALVTLASLLP